MFGFFSEPAILVIHNSLRSHPAVTATLLDFLCRVSSSTECLTLHCPISDWMISRFNFGWWALWERIALHYWSVIFSISSCKYMLCAFHKPPFLHVVWSITSNTFCYSSWTNYISLCRKDQIETVSVNICYILLNKYSNYTCHLWRCFKKVWIILLCVWYFVTDNKSEYPMFSSSALLFYVVVMSFCGLLFHRCGIEAYLILTVVRWFKISLLLMVHKLKIDLFYFV